MRDRPSLASFHPHDLMASAAPFLGEPPDLSSLRESLLDRGPEITQAFYANIANSSEAASFIQDEAKLQRLHHSLGEWLDAFLSSAPDASVRAELAVRMTLTHLRIGMPLELTLLGHKALRSIMVRELMLAWPAGDRAGLIEATELLQRGFDYDLLLMVSCYHGEAVAQAKAADHSLTRANERLEQSLRGQEDLLRTTSHELRTPLAGLVGMLRMLKRGVYEGEQERAAAIEDALGAAHHLQILTDDLLHVARLDLGKDRVTPQEFDLLEASEAIVRRVLARAGDQKPSISLQAHGNCAVHADPQRHEQILSNLLQNAVRHASGGPIRVELHELDDHAHIETRVIDEGDGIDPELLPKLFQPFTQSAGRGGSLGLGLTICRRLVLAMGGRIVAESDGMGQGACFAFTLPLAGRSGDSQFVLGPANARFRVLLVDDDAVWSHDLATVLCESLSVQVHAASDAAYALDAVREHAFDLILLDIALPSASEGRARDGLMLLEELGRDPACLLARKWLVSGHDPRFLQPELEGAWHDRFFSKSEVLSDLGRFVHEVGLALGKGR